MIKEEPGLQRNGQQWLSGFQKGIPVGLGYLAVSFSFGLLARNQLTLLQAGLMSGTNYASAGQFAGLDLIAVGASYLEMILTQGIINLRYSLMACSISLKLEENTTIFQKLIIAFGLTDEVFGISVSEPGKLNRFFVYGIMSIAMPCWVLGTVLGVGLGNILPSSLMSAMNLALYSMFIAIILPPAKKDKVLFVLIISSMILSFMFDHMPFTHLLPHGVKIVALTLIIALGAAVLFPIREDNPKVAAKHENQITVGGNSIAE